LKFIKTVDSVGAALPVATAALARQSSQIGQKQVSKKEAGVNWVVQKYQRVCIRKERRRKEKRNETRKNTGVFFLFFLFLEIPYAGWVILDVCR